MAEKKKYTLVINGSKYPILTDESEEYVKMIEFNLNKRIHEAQKESGMVYSEAVTMALLSIELCDSLLKLQAQNKALTQEVEVLRKNTNFKHY